jgi:hypothetical protein
MPGYRAPRECPVCAGDLVTTRLGCHTCGSELAGDFAACDFCALDPRELELLTVFLASRGNLREVEKHLGVSYPTARARFTDLLVKLGLAGEPAPVTTREQVLEQVAAGTIAPDQAAALLASL